MTDFLHMILKCQPIRWYIHPLTIKMYNEMAYDEQIFILGI